MVHLIYNGENQLVKVDGGQGKYIQIDYEQDKIKKTITDSIGRTIIYSYNDNNLLQKAIDHQVHLLSTHMKKIALKQLQIEMEILF